MVKTDDVNGPLKKPTPVGVDFAQGFQLSLKRQIKHFDTAALHGGLVGRIGDLPESRIIFIRFFTHVESWLDPIQAGQGLGRQFGTGLIQNRF